MVGVCITAPEAMRRLRASGATADYDEAGTSIRVSWPQRPGRFEKRGVVIRPADSIGSLYAATEIQKACH